MTTSADNTKFLQIQDVVKDFGGYKAVRSEEHTSELQSP